MSARLALLLSAAFSVALLAGLAPAAVAQGQRNAPSATLSPFKSDAELIAFLKKQKRAERSRVQLSPSAAPADAAAPAQEATGASGESITNTQEAGVDEGGIVKMHGDTLVVLRRGRLFTVSTRAGELKAIDYIDAYPPGAEARGDWYDEMLVSGNRVIVIGYSYSRGGTEINRFRIDAQGRLSFEDAYHLKSNDYYSSRNYASRLIGTQLVVYSPLYLPYGVPGDSLEWLPGLRRWSGNPRAGFTRVVSAREIYLPPDWRERDDAPVNALHTVTSCDLAAPALRCRATSVLGPHGRTFYVSPNAVYVWVSQSGWGRQREERAASGLLYRMPLDSGAPSAVGVRGAPIDQFSFREDWNDGRLNVLVRSEGGGDAMWNPEFSSGAMALLRLPLAAFGDGGDEVQRTRYRSLPAPGQDAYYAVQNRFVGDYLLYGAGNSWGRPQGASSALIAVGVKSDSVTRIPLGHGIDRIEAMGRDAVVVGTDSRSLHFRAIELTSGWRPVAGDRYTLEGAAQGETRSHAFFFKLEPKRSWGWGGDDSAGVLGLPVARAARPAYRQLVESSAAMIFVRRVNRRFLALGEIGAREEGIVDDACKASCADWYGNARPIFLARRTFALMGYELVEGEIGERSVREIRRINFAPRADYRGQ